MAFQFDNLKTMREAALRAAVKFRMPCFLWQCGPSKFTYRIGSDEKPTPGAILIETTRTGIRFPLNSGAVFRVAISVKVAQ